ncbi:PREDICTED: interleukin-4 [Ficedula albicollis]|uniref:interleukin-4 n=1 Tax=Ficedula albicollis TaxID=59894 RepID=UPI0003598085|nr:PREDICTED: interleukin-4 [Ficedula albicollis]
MEKGDFGVQAVVWGQWGLEGEKAHTVTDHRVTQSLRAEEVQPKQAMSILVQVLLTFLVLSACLGDVLTLWTHTLRTNMLKESIQLLDQLQQVEVACNNMNVTNIFADYKRGNNMEILCKAATVAQEGQSCHKYLEGIYYNLLSLVWGSRARHKKPCPAASGSTISLKDFLKELHQVLQEEFKSQK